MRVMYKNEKCSRSSKSILVDLIKDPFLITTTEHFLTSLREVIGKSLKGILKTLGRA